VRYWHGGIPGLKPGDLVVPGERHYVDGCAVCESKRRGENYRLAGVAVDPINAHEDMVYVTTDREYARFYASKYPRGDLYTVEPVGDMVDVGSEDPFPTWAVPAARVVSVYDTYVCLSSGQRRTLLNRWRRVDQGRVWV
jgi:hypothetical protein